MFGVGKGVYLLLPVLAGASFCADIVYTRFWMWGGGGGGGLVFTIHQKISPLLISLKFWVIH